jgi:hypothetical protein
MGLYRHLHALRHVALRVGRQIAPSLLAGFVDALSASSCRAWSSLAVLTVAYPKIIDFPVSRCLTRIHGPQSSFLECRRATPVDGGDRCGGTENVAAFHTASCCRLRTRRSTGRRTHGEDSRCKTGDLRNLLVKSCRARYWKYGSDCGPGAFHRRCRCGTAPMPRCGRARAV